MQLARPGEAQRLLHLTPGRNRLPKLGPLPLYQGGHLTPGSPVNGSGKLFRFVAYGVYESDERFDFDDVR
ncbi:MAG: hypothetical protein ACJ8DJ_23420, partial [Gemmatimonadales bacterium]